MRLGKLWVVLSLATLLAVPNAEAGIFGGKRSKKKSEKTEQTDSTSKKKESKYEKLLKNAVTAQGDFVTLHKVNNTKIYLEYPLKHIGRRILIGGTVASVSDPTYVSVGYKYVDPLHLQVELRDTLLVFNEPNAAATLNSNDPGLKVAFEKNFIPRLYKQCPILAYNEDSTAVVIDFTSMVYDMGANGGMLQAPKRDSKEEKERSVFGELKAFDDNASIELQQDVSVMLRVLIFALKLGDITTVSKVSLLLLPEEPMAPRIQDSRIGVFWSGKTANSTVPKYEISTERDGLRPYLLANRWRIEPVDMAAWERGDLVAVKKPIVWYVDDAFPSQWRESIHKGVLMWNKAFEEIGLKDVIQVRDFPTEEEDPAFDPDNLKYSCLRYSPSPTMNAMGPSWVDPVTGEILNASVIVYNDIIKLINNWRFIQTAQIDPQVRTQKMPREIVDESMMYVISHEVGHTLGLMHNMAASSAFPVDSLRSAAFTQKYGTTPSIMDYARFNYVAQPGDQGVKLTPPDLGIYDKYVIKWLYSPVPQAKDMWDEAAIAGRLIDEKAGDPLYRYGRQQFSDTGYGIFDPSALAEDLGDDPIKAGEYGIRNLKYILPNMNNWIKDDDDASLRQELYVQLANQYYRYLTNVMYQIGGVYLNEVKESVGKPVVPVDKARQKESLAWVVAQLRTCDWINLPELTDRFPLHTDLSATISNLIATNLTTTVPNNVTLSSQAATDQEAYTIKEYFDDLYREVFNTTLRNRSLTLEEKVLQRSVVTALAKPMVVARNAQKFTEEGLPVQVDHSSMPSYEELTFTGQINPDLVARFGDRLQELEEQYGKGTVAASLLTEEFGESRYPFQRGLKIDNVSEIESYSQSMIAKINTLMRSRMNSAPANDRAHYEYLWRTTVNALNN